MSPVSAGPDVKVGRGPYVRSYAAPSGKVAELDGTVRGGIE